MDVIEPIPRKFIRYVKRDTRLSEDEDFQRNVAKSLRPDREAIPRYAFPRGVYIEGRQELVGWTIQFKG